MTVSKIVFDIFLWTKIQGKYFQDINKDESITDFRILQDFFMKYICVGALVNYIDLKLDSDEDKYTHDQQMKNIFKWIYPKMMELK